MRVLITGSAGNIGKELVKALRAADYEIRTFDRTARGRDDDWEHICGDLRDPRDVRRAVEGMDAVMHLAAIPHDRYGSPEDLYQVNVGGTLNVLMASVEAGVERIVYYSSVNALGNFMGHKPSMHLPIDDTYPHHPMSPYQLSKHLCEEACKSYTESKGIKTFCLRPMYVSHPDHYRWRRHRSPEQRAEWSKNDYWAYVDVRDLADASLRCLTLEGVDHDAFLLSADETVVEIPTAELVDQYYPDTPWLVDRGEYLAANANRSLVDSSHAKEVLGWQPKHTWYEAQEGVD